MSPPSWNSFPPPAQSHSSRLSQSPSLSSMSHESQRKAMPENVQTIAQLHSSHMLARSCSKFSKPDFNSMWTMKFQMFRLDLEKAEEPEIRLPTSVGSSKRQESSRKTSISALLTMPKPLTVWITINCGKFWKKRDYQTTWSAFWEICIQVKKQQLELDMERRLLSNRERSTSRLYIVILFI